MNKNQTENIAFEDDILKKYDNGIYLNEDDIYQLISSFEIGRVQVNKCIGGTRVSSLIKIKNRYFETEWFCSTRKRQDDYSDSTLSEVVSVEKPQLSQF